MRLAYLFDVVVILCVGELCVGQLESWPMRIRDRVCLADAQTIYQSYDSEVIEAWRERHDHSRLVSLAYAAGLKRCRPEGQTNASYLVLEHDFFWIGNKESYSSVARFVKRPEQTWDVIRFGYCPRPYGVFLAPDGSELDKSGFLVPPWNAVCRPECRSERASEKALIGMPGKGCEIWSSVAQAISSNGAAALIDFGEGLVDGRPCLKYQVHGRHNHTCAVDLIFTTSDHFGTIHYHFPPLIIDPSKKKNCHAINRKFVDTCLPPIQ